MVETTEQIVREAPGIEAYKLGLLKQAERLADQPVGVLQFDENGQPITETYQYVDEEGNTQTGTRQQRMLPPQQVAAMSGLQTTALANTEAGIGGYKPYLDEAGFTLGDAQTAIGGVMSGALPFQTEAAGLMRTGAANVPGQLQAAQQGIQNALASGQMSTAQAQAALAQIGVGGQSIATQSVADQLAAYDAIPGVLGASTQGMGAAALAGGDVAAAARQGGQNIMGTLSPELAASTDAARGMTSAAAIEALGQAGGAQAGIDAATDAARLQAALGQQAMTAAGERGIGAYEQALGGVGDIMGAARGIAQSARTGGQTVAQQAAADQATAIQSARGITAQAAQALQQAGALGTTSAQQGIAGLGGTTGAFDPRSAQTFVNQFDDAAVQQALSDISRQGQIAQQGVRAQAVGAGAFGGSRQAVAEQELQRNILEQQGRTAGQMRQAGFESAAQRAQAAFEAQQGRAQQAAQLTGALGAQGAQAGLSAAQAAGQLGLSAEQLAAQSAQQQGQLGLSAEQLAAQTGLSAEQLAQAGVLGAGQLGLSASQLQGQLAGQAAQMGMTAEQMAQQGALQGGQLGVSAAQIAGQLGLSGEQLASANSQALAQYGVNLESLAAQTGMSAAQLAGQLAGQAGQLGLQGATAQAGIAQAAGQTGLAGQQLAGQLAGQAGQLGQGQAALGVQGSQQAGALGLQGQELMGRLGEGIGTLGVQYGQLGLQQGDALGTLGLRQAALGEATQKLGQNEAGFLFDMGQKQQVQQQAEIEAARASQLQQLYEPYQRVGFLSDIYKGAPSSQQSITGATAPTASTAQQILGLVGAAGSAYAGASKAGLFG
jgi:hypothetical protein